MESNFNSTEYLDNLRPYKHECKAYLNSCEGYKHQEETLGLTEKEQSTYAIVWRRALGLYETDYIITYTPEAKICQITLL